MADNDPPRFDDSEEEDDGFNPAPADVSDEEGGDGQEPEQEERRGAKRARSPDDDEDGDDDAPPRAKSRNIEEDEDEEGDEDNDRGRNNDNDDEDEEEEEDDDDDEDVQQGHRRKRRRDRRNAFIDIEAEVDDEDEVEDDEKEGEEIGDFIDNAHPDDAADAGAMDDDRRHRELDRRREMEASMDAEKQAEILRQRYGNRRPARGFGDSAVVPKRLLLPSVDDPSIWGVRCKEGKEREVVFSIQKRIEERIGTRDELAITAAFERGGPNSVMKGLIYVEAQRSTDVFQALENMLNVYPRSKMVLVEIKDMPELLRVVKTPTLEPGAWVRLKKPAKYAGDLGQVLDVTESGLEARVRFIPRLDYGVRDSLSIGGKKRAGMPGSRPPQKLFSEAEAKKHGPRHIQGSASAGTWTFHGDNFEQGFQVKDIMIGALQTVEVNPSLEEVSRFASGAEDGTEHLDLKALSASLKDNESRVTYLPGDVIEVYAGEQRGVVGTATNVQGDIVTMSVTEGDLAGQTIEVPTKGLRKRFEIGDHVKVIGASKFRDEVGTVVKISEDRVTILTDQTNSEVTVFSKDLREASDMGGQGSLGQYSLQDLVQLDPTTVGCVVKVDRESLGVLDQFGEVRQVMPSQISNKLPQRKQVVAADRSGSEIRMEDVVKEASGLGRQGKIIHVHRSFVFLHTNDTTENSGIFVTRANLLNTIAAKGGRVNAASTGPDLNAMNPALRRNPDGDKKPAAPIQKFGRDKAIDKTVIISKGPYKGLLGIVKESTEKNVRVELHTKSKTISVPRSQISFREKIGGAAIDINGRGRGGFGAGRGGHGDRVPSWQSGGRTPMTGGERVPAWGSRTPAISGGRTPAWKQDTGSRTPSWAADGSRTVNPYDGSRTAYGSGGRTPAWQSGARTPAVGDPFGAGSRTPAYGGGGDSWNSGSKTPAWGAASAPTPGASNNDSSGWGYTPGASGGYDAPTPGASLGGPAGSMDAPTPGAYAAPTPGAGAPTPAGNWQGGWGADAAPTPAASAPTPGAGAYYGAPTPGVYGGAAETPAGPTYTDDD